MEGEVTIRVHAEKRNATNPSKSNDNTNKSFKRFKYQRMENSRSPPEHLQCVLCNDIHPVYKCESFKAMNITGRKNHIKNNGLCERCLRKKHEGQCEFKKCNEPCPKCKPAIVYHNSTICPNKELNKRLALLAREEKRGKKRKSNQDNKKQYGQGKKRYTDSDKYQSEAKKSKAIKRK